MTENTGSIAGEARPDELAILKQRARVMGINFSNNIGVEALREKINAKLDGAPEPKEPETNPFGGDPEPDKPETPGQLRMRIQAEQMKLVRVRITCMNPLKKDIPGEIFTVANEYLGTVRKYVPFGEATDDGWHIPYCLYTVLEGRKFQNIRTIKDKKSGHIRVESNWAKEFAIEVLPPLTEQQLDDLRRAQLAAG